MKRVRFWRTPGVVWLCAGLMLSRCQRVSSSDAAPADVTKTMNRNENMELSLPEIPPAKLFQHVLPREMVLDNGMTLWYVYSPVLPLVTLRVAFDEGASGDGADKSGCTSMAAAMLKEGAAGKTAQQLSDEIENLGASLDVSVNQDGSSIYLQSLTQFFERGLDLLSEIWLRPDFEPSSFERLRKIVVSRLSQRKDAPQSVARLASDRMFYGPEHPYGRPVDGYEDTVGGLDISDVRARYERVFDPSGAAFFAVGNIEPESFRELLNARFGGLEVRRSVRDASQTERSASKPELRVVIVDKPDAPQTVIRIVQPGLSSRSQKTLSWQFVNIPFGDSFTSRLMQNIREDKGYSYGAGSAVVSQKLAGLFVSSSAVDSRVTGPALKEFMNELGRLPKGDFSQEEFERARETWKSEFVQSFETQSGVLATISNLYVNGKPLDYVNGFARGLESYTLERFNEVAREFPSFEEATIVLVGDREIILDQIAGLGLPAPVYCDLEGRPVP